MGLKIQLFGKFKVWHDGKLLDISKWKPRIAVSLLQLLASDPGKVLSNGQLTDLFWPNSSPRDALHTLRNRVAELRKLLEPKLKAGRESAYIISAKGSYCFNPSMASSVDTHEFKAFIEKAEQYFEQGQVRKAADCYGKALGLYKSHFLESELDADYWAIEERERYRQLYMGASLGFIELLARKGQYRKAIEECRALLKREPLGENAYRKLMLLHYLVGEQPEALRAYGECSQALMDNLGVGCSPETKRLHEHIQNNFVPGLDQYPRARPQRFDIPYSLSPGTVPFVGRQEESSFLQERLEKAQRGEGSLVLISGEAGVGKTRLVQELIRRAGKRPQFLLLQGNARKPVAAPFQPWPDILRSALSRMRQEELGRLPLSQLADAVKLVPALRDRIPSLPELPQVPPQQEQQRLLESISQILMELVSDASSRRVLVLVLEDLQWAESSSLNILDWISALIEKKPVCIIGTFRQEEVGAGHPLGSLISKLEKSGTCYRAELKRLNSLEVSDLVGKLPFKLKLMKSFCALLYDETGGNPLFLVSALQHFFEKGLVKARGAHWVVNQGKMPKRTHLPESVRDLALLRLAGLGESEKQVLRLASVLGNEFDLVMLKLAWAGSQEECAEALMSLTIAQFLIDKEGRGQFIHDKLWEAVYEEMPPLLRRTLHQRILQSLEQRFAGNNLGQSALFAHHAYHAGEWEKAAEYALHTLKAAVKQGRFQAGLQMGELGLKALANVSGDRGLLTLEFDLLLGKVETLHFLGRREEQGSCLGQFQGLAEQLGDKQKLALVHQKRSIFARNLGNYPEAEEHARRAVEFSEEARDPQLLASSLNSLGNVLSAASRDGDAIGYYERSLRMRTEMGDKQGKATTLVGMGICCRRLGRYEESLGHYRDALDLHKLLGDMQGQAADLNNMGNACNELGRYEEALGYLKDSLALFQELRHRQGQAYCLHNIGNFYHFIGMWRQAMPHYEKALELSVEMRDVKGQANSLDHIASIFAQSGKDQEAEEKFLQALRLREIAADQREIAISLTNIGRLRLQHGLYAKALDNLQKARDIYREMDVRREEMWCLSLQARAQLGLGKVDAALSTSSLAMQLLQEGHRCDNPHQAQFIHFLVLSAAGKQQALQHLQQAYGSLVALAGQLKAGQFRESFLSNVPGNSEIVSAWEEHRKEA